MIDLVGTSAFVAAGVFGLRHGVDWDHLAALTDLTGSQTSARRSMRLATLYALGHACTVLVLGVVAILFAERLPVGVDEAMERVVGLSLVALGIWMVHTTLRTGALPPLRSRWMLVLEAIRSRLGRGPGPAAPVVIVRYGTWSSFGVGSLHGVGAETPTQLLVFAAAVSADGRATSIGLLVCFLVGLVVSNTAVAAASTLGYQRVLRHRAVAGVLAAATALFSLVLGTSLLFGIGPSLPELLAT